VRQFLVAWISVLDSVPDLNMIAHLPAILEGVFLFLSDPNKARHRRIDIIARDSKREAAHMMACPCLVVPPTRVCRWPRGDSVRGAA
jgi:hypothetical protein